MGFRILLMYDLLNIARWPDALSFLSQWTVRVLFLSPLEQAVHIRVGCGPLVTVDLHRMPRTSKPSYLIQHYPP